MNCAFTLSEQHVQFSQLLLLDDCKLLRMITIRNYTEKLLKKFKISKIKK